jgi:hypothetical protein
VTGEGFGQLIDTIGDYNGAPGMGLGAPFNTVLRLQPVAKVSI